MTKASPYQPHASFAEHELKTQKLAPKFVERASIILNRLYSHYIHHRGKKFTAKNIARSMKLKRAQVVPVLRWLRLQQYPICTDGKGFWYSEYQADIQQTRNHLQSRVSGILAGDKAMDEVDWSIISGQYEFVPLDERVGKLNT